MRDPSNQLSRETLEAAGTGDGGAAARLMPLIYDDLRAIAGAHMRPEAGTLCPAVDTFEPGTPASFGWLIAMETRKRPGFLKA